MSNTTEERKLVSNILREKVAYDGDSGEPEIVEVEVYMDPEATSYLLVSATSVGNPSSNLVGSAAVGSSAEYVSFTINTPATANLPSATSIAGAYVEWDIKDIFGDTATIDPLDLACFILWLGHSTLALPVDSYVAIALTAGGVADINNAGTIHGLRYDAAGNKAFIQGNAGAGAGWTTPAMATAADPLARGLATDIMTNNGASVYRQTIPLDAGGYRSSTASSSPTPAAANTYADGPMTKVAIVVGWSGTTGPTTATIEVSLRSVVSAINKYNRSQIVINPAAISIPDPPLRFVLIGDSNSNSTTVDSTWGVGPQNVQTGWTYRHNGANSSTYPTGLTPGVGMVPYLINHAIARGATTGTRWVIRRGTNGANASWPGTIAGQISGAFTDVTTLGGGDPDIVIWVFGANDAVSLALASLYVSNMERALSVAKAQWPNAVHVLCKENMNSVGTYPYEATILSSIDALAAKDPTRVKVMDGNSLPNFDLVHWSTGVGGGQQLAADGVIDVVY